jgi:hypothetical protein
VRLEKPLYQDVAADIREIYRTACLARWDFEQYVTSVLHLADRREAVARYDGHGTSNPSFGPRSSHAKGVVRFSGVFDEDDGRREISDESDQVAVQGTVIRLEDLSLLSEELWSRAEEYLASLNTVIAICGRYFGQEEGDGGDMSGTWSEEDDCGSYEEGEDEEEQPQEQEEEEEG